MSRSGLLLSAVLLSASTLVAQSQRGKPSSSAPVPALTDSSAPPNPEPWWIIQKDWPQPNAVDPATPLLNVQTPANGHADIPLLPLARKSKMLQIPATADAPILAGGTLCYSIRSYLMARDSKDSDSTHLVGTSTCQPAQHYSLKTTDPLPHAGQR